MNEDPKEADSKSRQEELEEDVCELLRAGKKIEAVKRFREATGTGLKEAKEAVEAVGRKHQIETPSGCLILIGMAAFTAAGSWLVS